MIEHNAKKTKIISSFHGSSLSSDLAHMLSDEELDVIRLVYEPACKNNIQTFLRELGQDHKASVMLDVSSTSQGSVVNRDPSDLSFGDKVTLGLAGKKTDINIETSEGLSDIFVDGAEVFIGYGHVCLRVESVGSDKVELTVTQGGTVSPKMDILVPATHKEGKQIALAEYVELLDEVDFLVVSGFLAPTDFVTMRAELQDRLGEKAPWLIAKIHSVEVYERLGELLPVADGVMISRREIATTTNPATVPMITKEIIQRCNDRARIVVTASEILASMRYNVTPTRAEVSDIANAIIDGTDAIIISEEVAEGANRARALGVIGKIIRDIEAEEDHRPNWVKFAPLITNEMDAITYHAYRTAERVGAKAVVCLTKEGNTALRLSSHRVPMPIVAVTFSNEVLRRLSLVRGVQSVVVDVDPNLDEVLPVVSEGLLRDSWLKRGDSIIFVAVSLSPVGRDASNLFTVQTLQ